MSHPLVLQLRFARSEFVRGLDGVSDADARRRLMPMNCISWIVGHLANQEHRYWCIVGQNRTLAPDLNDLVGWSKPASTPPLDEMWAIWREITAAADVYLDALTPDVLQTYLKRPDGQPLTENVGTLLLRNTYHYWYHLGEASAIRQQLGHGDLPQFVGDITGGGASYQPEA